MTVEETRLVAGFYEAAFDPAHFPAALDQLAEFGGGHGASLLVWDKRLDRPALVAPPRHFGPDAAEANKRHYAALDPYRSLLETLAVGLWTACTQFFDDGFVAKDAFFNEYLIPRGTRYRAAARLLSADHIDTYVAVHRRPGQMRFSSDELQRLTEVGRHLARAVKVYIEVARTRPAQDAAMALLDQAAPPVVLVDGRCRVLFVNPAGEALLAAGEPIDVRDGRLSASHAAEEHRLQLLVAAATTAARFDVAGGEMLVRRPGRAPITVLVAPVGPTATLDSLAPVPAALVLLSDPTRRVSHSTKRLQALLGLTSAEAALAQGLLNGKRLAEIATDRQVSVETVRTQLRCVFQKTGVSRQADLVRMLQAMVQSVSGWRESIPQDPYEQRGYQPPFGLPWKEDYEAKATKGRDP